MRDGSTAANLSVQFTPLRDEPDAVPVDARHHAVAVHLHLVQPLLTDWWSSGRLRDPYILPPKNGRNREKSAAEGPAKLQSVDASSISWLIMKLKEVCHTDRSKHISLTAVGIFSAHVTAEAFGFNL